MNSAFPKLRNAVTPVVCFVSSGLAVYWAVWTFLAFPIGKGPFPYTEVWAALAAASPVFVASGYRLLVMIVPQRWRLILSKVGWGVGGSLALAAACVQAWAFHRVSSVVAGEVGIPNASTRGRASQPARDATVAMEDRHFYEHRGFDWEAMHEALRENFRAGRLKRGGSTITQQLAKNLFLSDDRTVARKILEIPLTIELERRMTKDRILDLYMKSIPYGMGLKGIDAASRAYFHTSPDRISLAQAACLVGIVPRNPKTMPREETISRWRRTAIERVGIRFPERYPAKALLAAEDARVASLMYPFRVPMDRGATSVFPRGGGGVLWFSYLSENQPRAIPNLSPLLQARLGAFAVEARRRLGLVAVYHLGVFNDRSQRLDVERASAHAYGQAIDLAGFRFADGTKISVLDHARPEVEARLAPLERLLRKYFDHVVDWRTEPRLHQDHFHAEVRGTRPPIEKAPAEETREASRQGQVGEPR